MVPHKQRRRPTLFTGCEASTGKQILSALRNCRNNDDSSEREKKKRKQKKSGEGGPAERVNVFCEIQHWRPKGTSVSGNTSLCPRILHKSRRANLSLFKLAKCSPRRDTGPTPAQIYREWGGVGSSVNLCSIHYWHALPPCLSAACQWTPHCCNVPYCCCQHSHTTDMPRREGLGWRGGGVGWCGVGWWWWEGNMHHATCMWTTTCNQWYTI